LGFGKKLKMAKTANQQSYPQKLFYRINEVGKIAGVKPYVLRYWETEFKDLHPEKDSNSQRRYRQKDVELVLKIKELLYERRFTIEGARNQLKHELRTDNRITVNPPLSKKTSAAKKSILKKLNAIKKDLNKFYKDL
jgi:DNA-binding transcriptional MerR regulator